MTGAVSPSHWGSHWVRGIWIAFVVALCLKCWLRPGKHTVYPVYAAGAQHWWQDRSVYARYEGIDLFRYSPTYAMAFAPFAILPLQVGSSLWSIVNVAILFLAVGTLVNRLLPETWLPRRRDLFMVLALVGSSGGLWSGQSNSLVLSLVFFAGAAILDKRWWGAALFLTIPVYIKLWPLAVVLLLILCWPRPLIGRVAVLMVALAALPFLTRPVSMVLWQYHEWWASLTGVKDRWPGFRDAWTLLEYLKLPFSIGVYRLLQLVTALGLLVWCLGQRKRLLQAAPRVLLMRVISLWAGWLLLFGPASERLTYGLVAPSLAYYLLTSWTENRGRIWMVVTWLGVTLFSWGDVEKTVGHLFPLAPMLLPLSVAGFLGWLLWHESSGPQPVATGGSSL